MPEQVFCYIPVAITIHNLRHFVSLLTIMIISKVDYDLFFLWAFKCRVLYFMNIKAIICVSTKYPPLLLLSVIKSHYFQPDWEEILVQKSSSKMLLLCTCWIFSSF